MTTPIAEREITGITAKQLIVFVGGIISIIITVMSTYSSLKNGQEKNTSQWEAAISEVRTLRVDLKAMQAEQQIMQLKLATLQAMVDLKNKEK